MKIVVLGAGGPAGANVCRSLGEAGHQVVGLEANPLHETFAWDWCDEVLIGEPTVERVNMLAADVVLAQPDPLVAWLGTHRHEIDAAVPLPAGLTLARCATKTDACRLWWQAGVRDAGPVAIGDEIPDDLNLAKDAFGLPFWLRAATGAGARGATLVDDLRTGFHWIRYWRTRGVGWAFIAEEFLPGRDFAWSSVWWDGELVCSFARERLEYIYPALSPSGLTGTPAVARVVHDTSVNEMAERAVRVIDPKPHGVMSVDLREDSDGIPRPTEINAGRFFTTSYMSTALGVNMPDLLVRLATHGREWWLRRPDLTPPSRHDCLPDGAVWARHMDLPGRVVGRPNIARINTAPGLGRDREILERLRERYDEQLRGALGG